MTTESGIDTNPRFEGDGETKIFPFEYSVTNASDVHLYVALDGALVSTEILPINFTLNLNADKVGGTITYPTVASGDDPLESVDALSIPRETDYVQPDEFKNQKRIPSTNLEKALDNLGRQIADLAEDSERSVKVDVTSETTPEELLIAIEQARVDSEAAAAAAAVSEANALGYANSASANAILTAADVVSTNADVVQTGLDRVATAADRVQTGLDAAATAADRVQTGLDKVATAADRVQTGLDKDEATAQAVIAREGWEGPYNAGTTYAQNEKVQYNGSSFISLQDSNTGNIPDPVTNTAFWNLTALKGDPGNSDVDFKNYGEEVQLITTGITNNLTSVDGNYASGTISSATTINLATDKASGILSGMTVDIDMTVVSVITWDAGITWTGAEAPALDSIARYKILFTTIDAGATWLGALSWSEV